jgi:ribosome maturation factor RimP
MIGKEKIAAIAEELLANTDRYIVDVTVMKGNRISVFIDSDTSLTIEDCRKLSRELEERLDRDREDFELNVSSPGLDRPLQTARQYRKNVGRTLEVISTDEQKLEGKLVSVGESGIDLDCSVKKKSKDQETAKQIFLAFKDIRTAKVKIAFKK